MKRVIIILILFLYGCGYQPIYINQNPDNFIYKKINYVGEIDINRKITKSLRIREDNSAKQNNELYIENNFTVNETSKNSKGQVQSYRSSLKVKLIIKDNNEVIKNKEFTQDFSYGTMSNKYDLVKYQNEIKNNIINKIIEEINIFLNFE